MADIFTLTATDLAALLCSRVCHDIISPVGAINNGLELLDEGGADEDAMNLIRTSARNASARLQFARIAFGAAGSAGAQIDTGDAEQVARGFIQDDRTSLEWHIPRVYSPKNKVKLLLNLLMVAVTTIPRGGRIAVEATGEGDTGGFRLRTEGSHARIPPHVSSLLNGEAPEGGHIDAHAIQPHYTGLLARSVGLGISFAMDGDGVVISVEPA